MNEAQENSKGINDTVNNKLLNLSMRELYWIYHDIKETLFFFFSRNIIGIKPIDEVLTEKQDFLWLQLNYSNRKKVVYKALAEYKKNTGRCL